MIIISCRFITSILRVKDIGRRWTREHSGHKRICSTNKVKLTPPTKPLSRQGSRRCSGLIVIGSIFAYETGYQELWEAFLVTAAFAYCGQGGVLQLVFVSSLDEAGSNIIIRLTIINIGFSR
jgi:hypothetical protein